MEAELEPIGERELRDRIRERIVRHFLPVETTVLGLRIGRFTLWHWRTLDALGSPCVPDAGWNASLADLCEAVHVLTLPAGHAGSLAPRGWLWRVRAAAYARRIDGELSVLERHVMHDFHGPAKGASENSVAVEVPGWLYLAAQLIALGIAPAEAWAHTPGHARTLLAALDVVKGGPDFLGEHTARMFIESGFSPEDIGL